MSMTSEKVQSLLEAGLPGAKVTVESDGYHYNIEVVSEQFAGMSAVKKQQMVYAVLNEHIADGSIHAVNMKTLTPEEA